MCVNEDIFHNYFSLNILLKFSVLLFSLRNLNWHRHVSRYSSESFSKKKKPSGLIFQ